VEEGGTNHRMITSVERIYAGKVPLP